MSAPGGRRAWECDEGALPRLLTSERLGTLENRVTHCEHAPPWTVGITALMLSLARRGLLQSK